ncbi:hypothetical protein [Bartonella jaculi]|uniref:Uncharacterized protein n=1 Tax=Bartonella jaculi TaxID=686226 RepID=A0ABP9N8D9_9HYPH
MDESDIPNPALMNQTKEGEKPKNESDKEEEKKYKFGTRIFMN